MDEEKDSVDTIDLMRIAFKSLPWYMLIGVCIVAIPLMVVSAALIGIGIAHDYIAWLILMWALPRVEQKENENG
jgi:hypothetical protein